MRERRKLKMSIEQTYPDKLLDRTDLQLLLCKLVKEMDADELIDLTTHLTKERLELVDEDDERYAGTIEGLEIDDPESFSTWLSFMRYALGERLGNDDCKFIVDK